MEDNLQVRRIIASLNNEGDLSLDCKTTYRALCQDDIESEIHGSSREEQLNRLKSEFTLPTYDVLSLEYKEDNSKRLPVISESFKLSVKSYAQVTGKRIFINPNILTKSMEKMDERKNRRFELQLKDENIHIDTVQITIPAGYEMESGLGDLDIRCKYGNYIKKTVLSANQLIFYRRLEKFSGRFPAKEYDDVVKFYNALYDADHTAIVLVKKN